MPQNSILIVDDEPSSLAILKQILGNYYALSFARNGVEGVAAAKKHRPDLILLDIEMPGYSGYTVCQMLKTDPLTENIPVIFISALNEIGDETAGFSCGGVDYIIKPVSPSIVRARVATHLSLVRATTLERYVKQLEIEKAKTARLSRIHAVLSGTNSAIVRIREQQAMVEEACRIAVEHGGFGMAWIGLRTEMAGLLPAAVQGIDAGELETLLKPGNDWSFYQDEVLSKVVNSGKAAICNDVRRDSDYSSIYRDAQNRGYLAVIVLPLSTNEKIVGVMVLYAREAGYFDDEELKLLSELASDISFALQAIDNEKRANFLAYNDVLTALPNTALFLDRLGQLIQAATRNGNNVFAITINLDRFKQINDTHGRHIGDHALRTIARRLGEGVLQSCTAGRVGSDNFALAGEQVNGLDPGNLCEQIVALLSKPFAIDGASLQISVTLGIAVYPADASDAEALFKSAEAALKQAKLEKVRYSFYSSAINARIAEKIELENMLQLALENQQFVLHYQPKIDLNNGRIVGAEALIRWQHPERGLISPMEFIPLAEETGLIVPIGEWVIRSVCAQQAAWRREDVPIVPVALNLSASQFREDNLIDILSQALVAHELDARFLELELTESLVMQSPEDAGRTMHAFRNLGCSLSLDDFGTGYSSLAYLKRFPFNIVKIDRAFVIDITRSPEDAAIASAIIGMAHSLCMKVIAEGVETEAQIHFLRTKNCDQMQGFFFSRPVHADEFRLMLCSGKQLALELRVDKEEPRH